MNESQTATYGVSDDDYLMIASFRAALRKFLRTSEDIAHNLGLTPQRHQAMLAVRGFPGAEPPTVGNLASRLHIRHNSAVGLVTRLVNEGYLRREKSRVDQRRMHVRLTPKGQAVLDKLTEAHRAELRHIGPDITRLLKELTR
ncbi:MAG TPA: MarR family transcriptional regulator [Gammaproteobacteria bacterium]|jgi:DNA-binding MarR family transcriptional regulator